MRIAIFTEEDYTFMFESYMQLIAALKDHGHELVGIYLFPARLGKNTGVQIYLYYLRTFGFAVFVQLCANAIIKRLKQLFSSLFGSVPFTYRALGKLTDVQILRGKNPNNEEVVKWVKQNNIDVVFASFGYIIKEPLLSAARVAILNKHSALLPYARGLLPVFWTILEGKWPIGYTVHRVDRGIDTGEILFQKSYADLPKTSVFGYYRKIYDELSESLLTSIDILDGKRSKQIINLGQPSQYFSLPTRSDFKSFSSKRHKFI